MKKTTRRARHRGVRNRKTTHSGNQGTVSGDYWSPATSLPGEVYTLTGRIRAAGSFARGLRSIRRHPLRHEMLGAIRFFAIALPVVAVLAWLLDRLLVR